MAEEATVPDISLYSRVPPLDVPTAMALGQSILSAAPKSPPAVTDGLRKLGAALSRYSVKLIASYDDDATADWKQAVHSALRPFDELRMAQARRASSDRPSPAPTPPAPAPQ